MSKHTFLRITRAITRFILRIIARIDIEGIFDYSTGAYLVTGNHIGRLEAFLIILLAERDDIILILAEKYQNIPLLNTFAKKVDAIWINRFDADLNAMRQVMKRLKNGEVLAVAPEGTRSPTEALLEGKPGSAYLASKLDIPIVPIGVTGTEDRIVKQRLKRLQRLDIRARIGQPYHLRPQEKGEDRDDYLQAMTDEIMCRIAALLPPDHRGFYSDYPRVRELLLEWGSPYPEDQPLLATAAATPAPAGQSPA